MRQLAKKPRFGHNGCKKRERSRTGYKQAEQALRESEDRLRLATEAAELGTWDHDCRSDRIIWSERSYAIFRIPPGTPLSWELILSRVYPEDRERFCQTVAKSNEPDGSGRFEVEYRAQWPDGTLRWIRSMGQSFFDQDGAVVRRSGIIMDIAERRKAEEAMRVSEELYRVFFDLAAVGMVYVGPDARLIKVNDKYCELTGYPREELVGKPVIELTHPADREGEWEKYAPYLRQERPVYSAGKRYLRKDGSVRWVSMTARIVHEPDGQVRYSIGIIEDITERKQAEESLRQSEERYRILIDAMPQLVYTCGPDGRCDYASRRWEEYTGTPREEGLGFNWANFLHPDDVSRALQAWEQATATGSLYQVEVRFRNAHGDYRWHLSRGAPMKDAQGRIIKWFGTSTDITDIIMAREALARSRDHLEKLIQERTARLQEMVGELEHFSYTITHDMRAPLRAMKGYGELLLDESEGLSPTSKLYIGRIGAAAERMDQLILDALNYNKLVSQELTLTPSDCGALLRGMLDSYPQFRESHANIVIDGKMPSVLGNEAALTQCFSNLLNNAIKFVRPGKTPEVRIWAEERADKVRLWFEDNGIGIPENCQERIFQMFQRLSASYEGTGIGLALVRKAVERMAGTVGVESHPGQGSRFWLELKKASETS